MAIQTSSRLIGNPGIPTQLEVDDETGATEVYSLLGGQKRLIATSTGRDWEVKNRFRNIYNRENGLDLSVLQIRDLFNNQFKKSYNNDRAAIINLNSSPEVRKSLNEQGFQKVKNPEDNTTPEDTTTTPSVANDSSNQGGDTNSTAITGGGGDPNGIIPIEGEGMPSSYYLKYPIDMSDSMNKLQINIIEYTPKGVASQTSSFETPERQKGRTLTTIFLPVPGGISDQNQVSWNKGDMNALQQAAAEFAISAIEGGAKDATETAKAIANRISTNTDGLKKLVVGAMAGAASGLGSQLLTRETGAIINPNTELLFNGPTMRNFGFSFNMSARSEREAQVINFIIRALKQNMSVRRSQSGLFLLSPHIFELKYLAGSSQENPHLNKFKLCAMTGLNVNYTPNQTFMTLANNMPVAYQVDMQFSELEPIFNDDYQNDNSIGF